MHGDRAVEGARDRARATSCSWRTRRRSTDDIVAGTERAIALLQEARDDRGLAEAWRLVGEARSYQGRAADGQQALERALTHVTPETAPRSWNALSVRGRYVPARWCSNRSIRPCPTRGKRLEFARARSPGARSSHAARPRRRRGPARTIGPDAEGAPGVDSDQQSGSAYMAQWSRAQPRPARLAAGDPRAAERALRSSQEVLIEMGLNSSLRETVVAACGGASPRAASTTRPKRSRRVKEEWAKAMSSVGCATASPCAPGCSPPRASTSAERDRATIRLVDRTGGSRFAAHRLLAHASLRLANRPPPMAETDPAAGVHDSRGQGLHGCGGKGTPARRARG